MKSLLSIIFSFITITSFCQTWEDVGGGLNNSTHGLLEWNGQLVVLGSFNNNPCDRVALWDGTTYSCLLGGVGIVARAGVVWDGKLVVVGDFWNNFQPCVGCNGVAVWDGVSWSPLGNGVNNDVLTCTVWNNELVIGGDFTQADGVPIARIAKWNGTIWESVGPIGVFSNDIRCMTEFEDELWVGGDFNNVGGCSACDGVVKYDPSTGGWIGGNSGVDLVGGVNESVRVLYVNPTDGNLYMGGEFPELIDGNAGVTDYNMSGIAMYDGSEWTPLGTGLNEYCRAIHEYNGKVIAGGYFTTAGGVPANKIAAWDGTSWSAMGLGFDASGIDEYVKAAAEWNGIFFAGGAYTQAEGGPMNYIAQWYEAPTNPPTAWMTASSTTLCGSGCIDFLDNSTNSPTSWNWTFPGSDTPTSTAENPGTVCWSSPGTYTVSLQACNAFGCNTQDIDIEVTNGASVSVNDGSICNGGTVTLTASPSLPGGTFLWSPGGQTTQSIIVSPASSTTYSVTYTMPGCVSAPAISNVTVVTGYSTSESIDACQNSNITYPDGASETITASTSHISSLLSVEGCDSTVTTNVTMVIAFNTSEAVAVCANTLVTYPDGTTETVTVNTSHVSLLTSISGCDSTVTTNVSINPSYAGSQLFNVCPGETVLYPDGFSEIVNNNTTHTSVLFTVDGCDSIIVSDVLLLNTYTGNESMNICPGETVIYPDGFSETVNNNTSHTSILSSINGCDSTIITAIFVSPTYSISETVEVCSGTNYTYPDGTTSNNITVEENHSSALVTNQGCDSLINTFVVVISGYNTTQNVTLCEGENYTYPDGTVSSNIVVDESHTSNLFATNGCDSTIQTSIIVNPLPDNSVSVTNNVLTSNENGANYQWLDCNDGNSAILGETGQSYSPTMNGSYAVLLSLNGCENTSACEVINTIGIEEFILDDNFFIFPNPVSDIFTISTTMETLEVSYQIIDAAGRIVLNGVNKIGDQINIQQINSGTYTLTLNDGLAGKFLLIKL